MSSKQKTPAARQKPANRNEQTAGRTPGKKLPKNDAANQATVEEFDRAGLGVAPKE